MFDLSDSKCLVTGATGAIGGAIVNSLYKLGATVCMSGSRKDALDEIAAQYNDKDRIHSISCDLSDLEAVERMAAEASSMMGGITGLVCCAGITKDALSLRMKLDDWQKVIQVNLTSVFVLNKAALRLMSKASYGRVVNISSIVGISGNIGQANYAASKAGLFGMSKTLSREFALKNITVNCVAPGLVESKMTDKIPADYMQQLISEVPMKRIGLPEEVASGVAFLISKEASYITGTVLCIDGGLVA